MTYIFIVYILNVTNIDPILYILVKLKKFNLEHIWVAFPKGVTLPAEYSVFLTYVGWTSLNFHFHLVR